LPTITRLLRAYVWRLDVSTKRLGWSDDVFRLFGIPIGDHAPSLDAHLAMVHPDDRDDVIANLEAHFEAGDTLFTLAHRIVRPDAQIVHLSGAAERIVEDGRTVLSGLVQDVTAEREAEARAQRRDYLLRVAGELGRFGGWRVDPDENVEEWSAETERIHAPPRDPASRIAAGDRRPPAGIPRPDHAKVQHLRPKRHRIRRGVAARHREWQPRLGSERRCARAGRGRADRRRAGRVSGYFPACPPVPADRGPARAALFIAPGLTTMTLGLLLWSPVAILQLRRYRQQGMSP
jgi:PAS domain-containing protein